MTHPMSSMSGYVSYIKFTAGVDKGDVAEGDVFNDAFRLGKVDEKYTSERVVETVGADGTFVPAWTPIVKGAFGEGQDVKVVKKADGAVEFKAVDEDGKVTGLAEGDRVAYVYDNVIIP